MVSVKDELLPQFLSQTPQTVNNSASVSAAASGSTTGASSASANYANSYLQYNPNMQNLQQQQAHAQQGQPLTLTQGQFAHQINLTPSQQHQIILENNLHKQQTHMAGPRGQIPSVATTVTTQSIPLLATTSSNLVHASPQAHAQAAQAQAQAQAAAAAAVNVAEMDPDETMNAHEESGDITLHTADGDGHDGQDANSEESTRRVNLSGSEKTLLVKTFVEHERQFFDANVRNRDFWTMVNERFSQLINRPFKTARQAIYRYVKSARTEGRDHSAGAHDDGDDGDLSMSAPGSPGSRRRNEDEFTKYVDRAVLMFQQRKDMKEKRIKRSTSIAMTYGTPAFNGSGILFDGQTDSPSGLGLPGSASSSRISTGASPEYADLQHQQALSPTSTSLTKTPSRTGDGQNNLRHPNALGLQEGGPAAMSTPSMSEKRALNNTDAYGSRKRYKGLNNGTVDLADPDLRIQALEKKVESLIDALRIRNQRYEELTELCTQFFTKVTGKLDLDDPVVESLQNFISQRQRQKQASQQQQYNYQLQQQASQNQNQGQTIDINPMIHPVLIQQGNSGQQDSAAAQQALAHAHAQAFAQAQAAQDQLNQQTGIQDAGNDGLTDQQIDASQGLQGEEQQGDVSMGEHHPNLDSDDARLALQQAALQSRHRVTNDAMEAVVAAARAAQNQHQHHAHHQYDGTDADDGNNQIVDTDGDMGLLNTQDDQGHHVLGEDDGNQQHDNNDDNTQHNDANDLNVDTGNGIHEPSA